MTSDKSGLIHDISETLRTDPVVVRDYLRHMKRYLEIELQSLSYRVTFVDGVRGDIEDHGRLELGDLPFTTKVKSIPLQRVTHHGSTLLNATMGLLDSRYDLRYSRNRSVQREIIGNAAHFETVVSDARALWIDVEGLLGHVNARMSHLDTEDNILFGDVHLPYHDLEFNVEVTEENRMINSVVDFAVKFQMGWGQGNPARSGVIHRGFSSMYDCAKVPISDAMLSVRLVYGPRSE